MKQPLNVTITGAAGQIGYALAFRVAAGGMLGADQPINLHLLEITPALPTLGGVVMELNDCAFPTLNKVTASDAANVAFRDCHVALLVGARPRGPGMERKDLLLANAQIFSAQGRALNEVADPSAARAGGRQPCQHQCADRQPQCAAHRSAPLHRDDAAGSQSRAVAAGGKDRHACQRGQAHDHLGQPFRHAVPGHQPRIGRRLVPPRGWSSSSGSSSSFIPTVQQRGAAVIKARGSSSAASAASAAIDHVRTWMLGTAEGDWTSMAVPADGSYGIQEGVIYSYPVTCKQGEYQIVQGLAIDEFSRKRMQLSEDELREEREGVKTLLGLSARGARL